MRRRSGGEGGFTLLEVVVAMALFAAGIVALYSLYSGALRLSAGSRDASASVIYARQRMEEALLVPDPVEGVEQGTFGGRYRWEVETVFLPREEETAMDGIRLRVSVGWNDGGAEQAVSLYATRWGWMEKNAGVLSGGLAWKQPGFGPISGVVPTEAGPGQDGRDQRMQGAQGLQGDDYLRAPTRRRVR